LKDSGGASEILFPRDIFDRTGVSSDAQPGTDFQRCAFESIKFSIQSEEKEARRHAKAQNEKQCEIEAQLSTLSSYAPGLCRFGYLEADGGAIVKGPNATGLCWNREFRSPS
jgi:hypothetical protein